MFLNMLYYWSRKATKQLRYIYKHIHSHNVPTSVTHIIDILFHVLEKYSIWMYHKFLYIYHTYCCFDLPIINNLKIFAKISNSHLDEFNLMNDMKQLMSKLSIIIKWDLHVSKEDNPVYIRVFLMNDMTFLMLLFFDWICSI